MSPAPEGALVSVVTGGAVQHMPCSTDSSWTPGPVCTPEPAPQWLHLPPCSRASCSAACQGDASCPGRSVLPLGFSKHLPELGRCPTLGASGEESPGSAGACRPFTPLSPHPVLLSCPTQVRDQEPKAGAGADPHLQAQLCLFRAVRHPVLHPVPTQRPLGSHCPQRRACCELTWPRAAPQWQLENGGQAASCASSCRCHSCARPRSDSFLRPFPVSPGSGCVVIAPRLLPVLYL